MSCQVKGVGHYEISLPKKGLLLIQIDEEGFLFSSPKIWRGELCFMLTDYSRFGMFLLLNFAKQNDIVVMNKMIGVEKMLILSC